jgi:hypothetical protein
MQTVLFLIRVIREIRNSIYSFAARRAVLLVVVSFDSAPPIE